MRPSSTSEIVRTVLFDLDGTLIDSVELIRQTFRHTIERHRGRPPTENSWLAGLGRPLRDQFLAWSDSEEEINAMIATYRAFNEAHHDELVREFPGMREVVHGLRARGLALAVVTSKMRAGTRRGLRVCGLDDYFEVLVGADDVERHKPDPAPVVKAMEQLGAAAETTVFVGDSPHDIEAGRAAGVRTAAALWGPFPREWLARSGPTYWLAAPVEVAALVGGD